MFYATFKVTTPAILIGVDKVHVSNKSALMGEHAFSLTVYWLAGLRFTLTNAYHQQQQT